MSERFPVRAGWRPDDKRSTLHLGKQRIEPWVVQLKILLTGGHTSTTNSRRKITQQKFFQENFLRNFVPIPHQSVQFLLCKVSK